MDYKSICDVFGKCENISSITSTMFSLIPSLINTRFFIANVFLNKGVLSNYFFNNLTEKEKINLVKHEIEYDNEIDYLLQVSVRNNNTLLIQKICEIISNNAINISNIFYDKEFIQNHTSISIVTQQKEISPMRLCLEKSRNYQIKNQSLVSIGKFIPLEHSQMINNVPLFKTLSGFYPTSIILKLCLMGLTFGYLLFDYMKTQNINQ